MSTSTHAPRAPRPSLPTRGERPAEGHGGPAVRRLLGSRLVASSVAVLVVVLAGWLSYLPFTQTPSVQPASAPATAFSAERAMTQLEAVAATPRPMGSAEHGDAVAFIRARLGELGIESQVVAGVATRNDFDQVFVGRLRNVIARIPGTGSTGTVAMLSHFDSVPTSMNANDGGLGVAALLETARAITEGPPLANDVLLWFGDADETTALNALLLQEHPWFRDVRVGFAFEAPGVTGPSVLTFAGQGRPDGESPLLSLGEQESLSLDGSGLDPDRGQWLREALDALPDVTVALPLNDLGLGASPDLGMSMWGSEMGGVSFSQIGDSSGYHTDLDRPDRVSLSSLQDAGDIALALARHLGGVDLDEVPESDGLVAFTVAPGRTVTYPSGLALPAGVVVLVAGVALVVVARWRGRLTLTGVLLGCVTAAVSVAVAAVAAVLLTSLLAPDVHYARNPDAAGWRTVLVAAATLAVVTGLFVGMARLLRREDRVAGLVVGPVLVTASLASLTGAAMPALSYVFLWPALAGVAVAGWDLLRAERGGSPWPDAAVLAGSGAVVAVVGVPLVHLLASAASIGLPMFAAAIAVLVALLGSVLVLHLRRLGGRRLWVVPAGFAVLALVGGVATQLSSGFDADQPRPNHIQYSLDADTGDATWLSAGTGTDAWTQQFFQDGYTTGREAFSPGYFFGQEFDVITAPAPRVPLPAPELTVVADTTTAGVRTLELRLTSPRGAPVAHLDLELPGDLVGATVGGRTVEVDESAGIRDFPLAAYNVPARGLDITLSLRSADPITGRLTDYSNGLPAIDGMTVTERPADFMPAPYDFRDPTAVTRSVEVGPAPPDTRRR